MVLAGLAAGWGGLQLTRSFESFRRLRQQLWLNLAWIRTVLVTRASAARTRGVIGDHRRMLVAGSVDGSLNLNRYRLG